jgi:hypothetical protein
MNSFVILLTLFDEKLEDFTVVSKSRNSTDTTMVKIKKRAKGQPMILTLGHK